MPDYASQYERQWNAECDAAEDAVEQLQKDLCYYLKRRHKEKGAKLQILSIISDLRQYSY